MAELWHADSSMIETTRPVSVFLTALLRRRTWTELLYALLGLPLGVIGAAYVITTTSLSAGLLVTFVGLPLLAVTGLGARWMGSGVRSLANRLAGADVPPPQPFRANPGLLGWIGASMTDGTAWRARLYLLLKLPVGGAESVMAAMFFSYGVGGVSYAIWRPFLPCNDTTDGQCHRGIEFGSNYTMDTPWRVLLVVVAGVVVLLLTPWVVRGVLMVDRLLVRALLGPTGSAERLRELERTRGQAVDESAATLRRIERDLHDGTQARLVALAMNVGLAKEKLDEGGDPAQARALLETAHTTAKDAIVELRDLARGIHPPVLDRGLDSALATLAAHSGVPVELTTSITRRPSPAIETIAYFCVAELLTNVAKHSAATRARVDAHSDGGTLRLRVSDDGRGGAHLDAGGGLTGLTERVSTVDGALVIDSPPGGPTVVTVELPFESVRA
jgi:signal transduction histidine kinase